VELNKININKMKQRMLGKIYLITPGQANRFILPRHYAGRKPQITIAYGWFIKDKLCAVVTYGKPASNQLCEGICGKEYSKNVMELNRLVRLDECKEQLSQFVSATLRYLQYQNFIIVSYADRGMSHIGYIYQALNFLYTGITKERTDKFTEGSKHSRHYDKNLKEVYRKVRTAKHRYVFFATKNKYLKKEWLLALRYKELPYPKGQTVNYKLGEFQKPNLKAV